MFGLVQTIAYVKPPIAEEYRTISIFLLSFSVLLHLSLKRVVRGDLIGIRSHGFYFPLRGGFPRINWRLSCVCDWFFFFIYIYHDIFSCFLTDLHRGEIVTSIIWYWIRVRESIIVLSPIKAVSKVYSPRQEFYLWNKVTMDYRCFEWQAVATWKYSHRSQWFRYVNEGSNTGEAWNLALGCGHGDSLHIVWKGKICWASSLNGLAHVGLFCSFKPLWRRLY